MIILFVPMFIVGIILMIKNPALLKERLEAKEKQKTQDTLIKLSGLMFIVGFIIAGLDFNFKWLKLPSFISYISALTFLLAYLLWAIVLKQNTFLSRTIKVVNNQKVIDTGLYSVVRHPMYTASIILFLSIPLVLGSLFSFLIFLIYPFLIVKRINNEEKVLEEHLQEYKEKVKYRLIPFIW